MLQLFNRKPSKPLLDRSFGCTQSIKLRRKFRNGDFRSVMRHMQRHQDVDQRCFLTDVLADVDDRPLEFDSWVEAHPDCTNARLVSGAHALQWAWHARGYGMSDDVTDAQWEAFGQRLNLARRELETSLELDSGNTAAHGYLLRCCLGEGADLTEVTATYRQAMAVEPYAWVQTFNYFTYLCEKWFGSHEQMFEFARTVTSHATDGADVHAMVAYAHIEQWLFQLAFDEDQNADDYWLSDEVFDELLDSYKRWVNKAVASPYEKVAANSFLFCFASMNSREIMRVEVERIGPYPDFTPWRYLGDPVEVYHQIGLIAGGN